MTQTEPSAWEVVLETVITRVQKFTVMALAIILTVVMLLSTLHLGWLIGEEVLKPPKWLIRYRACWRFLAISCWY